MYLYFQKERLFFFFKRRTSCDKFGRDAFGPIIILDSCVSLGPQKASFSYPKNRGGGGASFFVAGCLGDLDSELGRPREPGAKRNCPVHVSSSGVAYCHALYLPLTDQEMPPGKNGEETWDGERPTNASTTTVALAASSVFRHQNLSSFYVFSLN